VGDLIVAGYPRSGNVWLSRLLGDALNRPVIGKNGAMSLATEGRDRDNKDVVMQAHVYPVSGKQFWNGNGIDLKRREDRQFVCVVRDPRDVLVSAAAFWGWSLEETMEKMVNGPGPLDLPPWRTFMEAWFNKRIPIVRYEDLCRDAEGEIGRLLAQLKLKPENDLMHVVHRQAFKTKRADILEHGDGYAFGKEAQLRHLRKGGTGEWHDALPVHLKRLALTMWRRPLTILGYHQEISSC
jgi:hypothetical protein